MLLACPPGFDCAFLNSCPNYIQACPEGYFCGTYAGNSLQDDIDYGYAKLFTLSGDTKATESNKEDYVVPDRTVQSQCYGGFYCPNASTILPCPTGHWCAERTVEPNECDGLSACSSEQTSFQVNFINVVIMLVLIVVALSTSCAMSRSRRAREVLARKHQYNKEVQGDEVVEGKQLDQSVYPAAPAPLPPGELVEVRVTNLNFVVNGDECILDNVNGTLKAGKINCILGPTGCGKSTLLEFLRSGGEGATSGAVSYFLKNEASGALYSVGDRHRSRFVGFVPQEDVFERQLTVRELLTFCALCRSRKLLSSAEATKVVDGVLEELSISHVAESVIGGGENQPANISGGQLKRVNIACELVGITRPSVLLLDEVTAGLDAAIALDLMKSLEKVCASGVTIVLVLQQPRVEIFSRIQHLFLMNGDGGIVFEGASSEAAPYFQTLGYDMSPECSDADFCLDVLNYVIPCTDAEVVPHKLHRYWSASHVQGTNTDEEHGAAAQGFSQMVQSADEALAMTRPQKLWQEFVLNADRMLKVRLRNTSSLLIYIAISMIMAIALSSGFSVLISESYLVTLNPSLSASLQPFMPAPLAQHKDWNVSSMGLEQLMFFMSSALGTAACLGAVPVFAGQASIARRERLAGLSTGAYMCGRLVADLVFVVLNGFAFVGVWCLFGHAGSFANWMAVILATAFAASAIGYISAAAVPKNSASVFAIIATFVCCVFAGVDPSLHRVSSLPVVNWPWMVSYATWTAEATYVTWSKYIDNDGNVDVDVQEGADRYGYVVDQGLGHSIGSLIALGIAMRIIALAIFYKKSSP